MKIIAMPRGAGKTRAAMELCVAENKAGRCTYIVCATQEIAHRMGRESVRLGLNMPFPISFHEFLTRPSGRFIQGYIIDDIDLCLRLAVPVPVIAITLTEEEPG